jgi:integrase
MSKHIRQSKPAKRGKRWQIRWIDENGKRRSQTWDNYEDAEHALATHKLQVMEVRRGLRVRPPKGRSFEELCQRWLEVRTTRKRTRKDDTSIIGVHLRPTFGRLDIAQITSEHIDLFSAALSAKRAPQTVRNVLILLGAMLRQAVEWGWLQFVPRIQLPRVRLFESAYRWLRTEDERDQFLRAAKLYHLPVVYHMYATAVHTGMRAGELAGLRWQDVDLNRRIITVQRSYDGPTKAGDIRHIPIGDGLLPILREWRLACGNRFVFPNAAGQMWDPRGRIFKTMFHKVLQLGGFPPKYITFHSLRHTFASHFVMNGGDLEGLQQILGHKDSKMTQRYAHWRPDAFDKYRGIMGPVKCGDGEVVEMRKKEEA